MSDDDQAAVTGEQIPGHRDGEYRKALDEKALRGEARVPRQRHEDRANGQSDSQRKQCYSKNAWCGGSRGRVAQRCVLRNKPSGRASRAARNTRWPKKGPSPEEIFAPNSWAIPMINPPMKVP